MSFKCIVKVTYFDLVIQNSSDENESQIIETAEKEIPLKGRKGRSAPKSKTNDFSGISFIFTIFFLLNYLLH